MTVELRFFNLETHPRGWCLTWLFWIKDWHSLPMDTNQQRYNMGTTNVLVWVGHLSPNHDNIHILYTCCTQMSRLRILWYDMTPAIKWWSFSQSMKSCTLVWTLDLIRSHTLKLGMSLPWSDVYQATSQWSSITDSTHTTTTPWHQRLTLLDLVTSQQFMLFL
jgi:hypothetical protein